MQIVIFKFKTKQSIIKGQNTMLDSVVKCACGAVNVIVTSNNPKKKTNDTYVMAKETFEKHFDSLELSDFKYDNCNHCINHWGIDINHDEPTNEDGELNIVEVDESTIDEINSRL